MVQREIADRLRAEPGSRVYGGPSVLVQLACEVRLLRTVDRAVFTPRPRVDSALIGLRRTGPAAPAAVVALVRDGFAHRRKSLARSLEHARPGVAGRRARGRWWGSGCRPTRAPSSWRPSSSRLWPRSSRRWRADGDPARAREAQPLPVSGRRREDGLHELRSLFCPLLLSDRIEVDRGRGRGRRGPLPGV